MKHLLISYYENTADNGDAIDMLDYLRNEFDNDKIFAQLIHCDTLPAMRDHINDILRADIDAAKREKTISRAAAKLEREFTSLLKSLKTDIRDDYRAEGCEDGTAPSMCVTFASNTDLSDWSFQTGDNSYSGGCYGFPFWGVVTLTRRSNSRELARDAIAQIVEQISN